MSEDANHQQPFPFQLEWFYREVGNRIREFRAKKGISQKAIADTVNLSRTSLTNIEKGRQKMLLHTFVEIASALGISATELFPAANSGLEIVGVDLPPNLPPEQRDFVERTLNPALHHEPPNDKQNSTADSSVVGRKRNHRASRKR